MKKNFLNLNPCIKPSYTKRIIDKQFNIFNFFVFLFYKKNYNSNILQSHS